MKVFSMDQWEVIRYIHKIGSPLKGTVIGIDKYSVLLETRTGYMSRLPFDMIEEESLIPESLPSIGEEISTVIYNFVDGVLYLSAKPSHTSFSSIQGWQSYYDFIETLEIGSEITGLVTSIKAFGIFVDIGAPYIGLIDVGHDRFSGGDRLPDDMSVWPAEGGKITCRISYFRLHDKQIGLGWIDPHCDDA
jgi:hypothetical protein